MKKKKRKRRLQPFAPAYENDGSILYVARTFARRKKQLREGQSIYIDQDRIFVTISVRIPLPLRMELAQYIADKLNEPGVKMLSWREWTRECEAHLATCN